MATPIWLPMPPSTTIESTVADLMKVKDSGEMNRFARRKERPGETREHRAHGKGSQLGVGGVDAERAAGDLVFAQRLPCAADRQPAQAHGNKGSEQRERENDIIKENDAIERRELQPEDCGKAVIVGGERNPKKVGRGMPVIPA